MLTQKECILTKILNCGSCDLEILEGINYDLDEIIDDLVDDGCLSLSGILEGIFHKAKDELKEAYNNLITDLKEELAGIPDDSDLVSEIEELESINIENDFTWYINYLDTHVYLGNKDIYEAYFSNELDEIENNMGYMFKG